MYPDIPLAVRNMMSGNRMRHRHLYWHVFKDPRINTPAWAFWRDIRDRVVAVESSWQPSVMRGEEGHGIDFIGMHRIMIGHVNHMLAQENDDHWPEVVGWPTVPLPDNDDDWPVPQFDTGDSGDFGRIAREALRDRADEMRESSYIAANYASFDAYAQDIESNVHDPLHNIFSEPAPTNLFDSSVSNDYLGNPFSSHVNSYFWKLHGWVDNCVEAWEEATGQTVDLSSSWEAPPANRTPLIFDVIAPDAATELKIAEALALLDFGNGF